VVPDPYLLGPLLRMASSNSRPLVVSKRHVGGRRTAQPVRLRSRRRSGDPPRELAPSCRLAAFPGNPPLPSRVSRSRVPTVRLRPFRKAARIGAPLFRGPRAPRLLDRRHRTTAPASAGPLSDAGDAGLRVASG